MEQCPKCDGKNMRNYVYVHTGEAARVYVRCADCGAFAARYVLSRYTSDEPYESQLRTLRLYSYASGKRMLKEVEEFGGVVEAEFERVVKLAREHPESRHVVELIRDAEDSGGAEPPDAD
jgi:hypothetical protein